MTSSDMPVLVPLALLAKMGCDREAVDRGIEGLGWALGLGPDANVVRMALKDYLTLDREYRQRRTTARKDQSA